MPTTASKPAAKKKSAAKKPVAAKKPAAKKPAATKKPAPKKQAVKKSPAKKPTLKKPAAKKPAAGKTSAKKPAATKKPAVKTAAVKKPAPKKTAAKKPIAVKKTAVKKAAAKKTTAKKPVSTKKQAAIKPAAIKKPVIKPVIKEPIQDDQPIPKLRYMDLYDAFTQGKLPHDKGYVVSGFFNDNSAYSIYEIVSYSYAKEIFPSDEGLTFVSSAKKLYILVEPAAYSFKYLEPASRKQGENIDKHFSELEKITAKNQTSIFIAKEPNETGGSFTVLKPAGKNYARIVFFNDEVISTIKELFELSFTKDAGIPQIDARNAAALISSTVNKQMSLKG